MKKILLLTLLGLAGTTLAADKLRFSTDGTYPPFSEVNAQGEVVGFDIDIGKALCAEMKRDCEFTQIDWDGLIPALKSKKTDLLIASMNATPERKESIAFSAPYYINPGVFVRAAGSNIELSEAGLKGKTIGVLRASVFDRYATDKFGSWAEIQRYNAQEEANLDALAGRVDVLFADALVLKDGFLERLSGDDKGKFEVFGPEVNDEKYFGEGISIGVRKEDEALLKAVNEALTAIKANGEYKKINDKYFKVDISGSAKADAPAETKVEAKADAEKPADQPAAEAAQ